MSKRLLVLVQKLTFFLYTRPRIDYQKINLPAKTAQSWTLYLQQK